MVKSYERTSASNCARGAAYPFGTQTFLVFWSTCTQMTAQMSSAAGHDRRQSTRVVGPWSGSNDRQYRILYVELQQGCISGRSSGDPAPSW